LNAPDEEVAEVIKGDENVMKIALRFISKAATSIDVCLDYSRSELSTDTEQIGVLINTSRKRGVKIRCITEITASNVNSCKRLMGIIDELRHLDGIAGTFYVSDTECFIPEIIHKKGKPASQVIYWNVKETVKQQQYVFDTLWNKAISGQQKINEIEKGELPEVIEIIRDPNETQRIALEASRSRQ
jgi:two-component system sensor histidine kinase VicK